MILDLEIYQDVANGFSPVIIKETGECVGTYLFREGALHKISESSNPQELEIVSEIPAPYVTLTPMQRHINNGEVILHLFNNDLDAGIWFQNWCIGHDYEIKETRDSNFFYAGGIGHDYEICLHTIYSVENEGA
jgi:hypothetical protein